MLRSPVHRAVTLALLAAGAVAEAAPPNVILFLVDDLGWQDVSVPLHDEPTPLNRRYRTPNLERLAAAGVRFTDAYASAPVCTPTRTSIMTGLSPGRSHITYWTLHRDRDTSKPHDRLRPPAWNVNGLREGDVTLPRLLAAAGYRTIHVGKAHFGAHGTTGADPGNLGFDVNVAGHGSGGPASFYGLHAFSQAGRRGEPAPPATPGIWDVPGLEQYHGQEIYLTEALALEAAAAVREAVADGAPFFLNMAPYAVHAPIMANPRYVDRYADLDPREAAYASMIETVDAALGLLLRTIDSLGVADETVVIFHSDNGGLSAHARGGTPHTHNAPLRSGKGSAYEGGVRVPLVVSWPGVTAPGSVCRAPVISHDLFPTILAAAGVPVPPAHAPRVDGVDLGPLLRGEAPGERRVLCWSQPHQWGAAGPGIHPFTSIRAGDWKLVYFHAEQRLELYDLATDIGERNDLASARPGRVAALAGLLDDWIRSRGAQLSIDRASGRPVALPGELAAGSPAGRSDS
ncbi:MAG: sulfatase [Planctomycetota bacterium]